MENISRREASQIACKLTNENIKQYTNSPDMSIIECWDWHNGLSAYIEIVYNGTKSLFDEIVADFNSNNNRKFINSKGEEVSYYRVMDNFLTYIVAYNYLLLSANIVGMRFAEMVFFLRLFSVAHGNSQFSVV